MNIKKMSLALGFMLVAFSHDCQAARSARAQSIRKCVQRAAEFDAQKEAFDAVWNQRRAKAPNQKIARAAAALKRKAAQNQAIQAEHAKHAVIDAVRNYLDKKPKK